MFSVSLPANKLVEQLADDSHALLDFVDALGKKIANTPLGSTNRFSYRLVSVVDEVRETLQQKALADFKNTINIMVFGDDYESSEDLERKQNFSSLLASLTDEETEFVRLFAEKPVETILFDGTTVTVQHKDGSHTDFGCEKHDLIIKCWSRWQDTLQLKKLQSSANARLGL